MFVVLFCHSLCVKYVSFDSLCSIYTIHHISTTSFGFAALESTHDPILQESSCLSSAIYILMLCKTLIITTSWMSQFSSKSVWVEIKNSCMLFGCYSRKKFNDIFNIGIPLDRDYLVVLTCQYNQEPFLYRIAPAQH